ncbi:hypothetical protein KSP40_PGU013105 [Platanthera guangdongensis]|uniref:Uncharacterized protein n=1 Tax=Platanthera guangdongensis TaxID=2320717 RepID=A0ABR2LGZ2_9ASPA
MDARDSSSVAVGRDGSSEEEVLTTALAKEAGAMFQSRRFEECVEVLNQLLHKKGSDPKPERKQRTQSNNDHRPAVPEKKRAVRQRASMPEKKRAATGADRSRKSSSCSSRPEKKK